MTRRRRLLQEALRFLAVGGAATVVSLAGFNYLVHGTPDRDGPMYASPIAAYVLANAVAGVLAYAGIRAWAFKHREVRGTVSGPVAFFSIGAVTMIVPVLCLAFSRYVLRLDDPISDNLSANVIGLGLSNLARFWAFRTFVFLDPARQSA